MKNGAMLLVPIVSSLAIFASACGGSGSSPSSSSSTGSANGSALSQAKAVVSAAEKVPTFDQYKPSKAAPPFRSGMHLALINGNAKSSGAGLQAKGVEQAASAVGWTTQQYDGMGTNSGKITAFQNALVTHPDGIVLVAIDQHIVSAPMAQAKAAGIPVVSTMAGNVQGTSNGQVYADLSGADYQTGLAAGSWIVTAAAAAPKTANVLRFEYPINNTVIQRDKGVTAALSSCTSCQVVDTVQYSSADLQSLTASVAPAIQTHPNVNFVVIDVGAYATNVVKAIQAMGGGFASQIQLVSFDCVPTQIADIQSGTIQAACDGQASVYSGWAAVDALNRAFHHQSALTEYVPSMLITKSSPPNVTDATGFNGGFDFAAAWKSFWGVK